MTDSSQARSGARRRGRRQPGDPPSGTAKDRALRLLSVRWRSRAELERRLARAGFPAEEIAAALVDLEGAGLVDDDRFATEVVRSRAGSRLNGNRAIRAALATSGVAPEVVERALAGTNDEDERAEALARRRAPRLSGLPPEAAFRRLFGLLVRRGYGAVVAREACRKALADVWPDGEAIDE